MTVPTQATHIHPHAACAHLLLRARTAPGPRPDWWSSRARRACQPRAAGGWSRWRAPCVKWMNPHFCSFQSQVYSFQSIGLAIHWNESVKEVGGAAGALPTQVLLLGQVLGMLLDKAVQTGGWSHWRAPCTRAQQPQKCERGGLAAPTFLQQRLRQRGVVPPGGQLHACMPAAEVLLQGQFHPSERSAPPASPT